MSNPTKHDIVKAYLEPVVIEMALDRLNFNFSPEAPDTVALLTDYSDRVVREFVNGDAELAYGFTILITKTYSAETDDLNLEAMNFAQALIDWMAEQNREHNLPDFGEGYESERIEPLQNMPNLAAVNAEEGLARYQIQGRILYRQLGDFSQEPSPSPDDGMDGGSFSPWTNDRQYDGGSF